MPTYVYKAQPLSREAFALYGDVIETEGASHYAINAGAIERFHDLARVDVAGEVAGRALISIARCNRPGSVPYKVPLFECHPLGSQAFIPLDDTPIVIAVAPPGEKVDPMDVKAFVSNGRQGFNYHRGVWHVPLFTFKEGQQLVIIDRGGPGSNCQEYLFSDNEELILEL